VTTFVQVTVTTYEAVAAPGGAIILTNERPVLLTVPPGS
jgi:hypothetical protein